MLALITYGFRDAARLGQWLGARQDQLGRWVRVSCVVWHQLIMPVDHLVPQHAPTS
jgi:hypothetical protein